MQSYTYLVGVLMYGLLFWLPIYVWRPQLRRAMLVMSLIAAPLGVVTLCFFMQDYWTTHYVFGRWLPFEELLFSFFAAGSAGSVYQAVYGEQGRVPVSGKRWWALTFFVLGIVGMLGASLVGINSIYASSALLFVFASAMIAAYPRLWGNALLGAVYSTAALLVVYFLLTTFNPDIVGEWWMLGGLSGLNVFGVPIEELMWGAAWGFFAGPVFEFVSGSRYIR